MNSAFIHNIENINNNIPLYGIVKNYEYNFLCKINMLQNEQVHTLTIYEYGGVFSIIYYKMYYF